MNNSYKLVYSEALNTWIAVAEHVSARGKKSALRLVTAAALMAGGAASTGGALAAPPLTSPPAVNQLPTGAQVAVGNVTISQTQTATAASMAVQQSSTQAIVNWQNFNVGANAKVNITQPSSSSVLLNRVMDSNPSQIFGQVNANGQVFLTNPNGVYFAPGSSVDVGSFTASTHSISDADFLAGKYNFSRNSATGSILNEGKISSGLGGYIALLAPEVRNLGVVVAQLGGTVAMAAGESYQLQFNSNNQLTNVLVAPSTFNTLVENGNAVQAPGGLVILSAQAASSLLGGVVKNSGSISATGLVNDGGVIRLSASNKIELTPTSTIAADAAPNSTGNGGRIEVIADLANPTSVTLVDGGISAKGGELGGDGGFVETSASQLKVFNSASISTLAPKGKSGNWLLDPNDFEVSSTGNISGSTLSGLLVGTSVTLQAGTGTDSSTAKFGNTTTTGTKGDINIYDAVSWSANTLTLNAGFNINVGSSTKTGSLTVTGTGALVLNPSSTSVTGYTANGMVLMGMASTPTGGPAGNGFNGRINLSATDATRLIDSSGSPVLKISGNNYNVITTLGSSSDYLTTSNNNTLQGMAASNNVSGKYFALGNDINASATSTWTNTNGGLGFLPIGKQLPGFDNRFWGTFDGLGHAVTNLYEYRPNVDSYSRGNVGLIAYALINARVANIGVTGDISGQTSLGGLVASFDSTSYSLPQIANSYSTVNVTVLSGNAASVGGLVGSAGYISNSYATGVVSATGGTAVGGLVGLVPNYGSSTVKIDQSFATGQVTGASSVGGLIGSVAAGSVNLISNSYATGNVSGTGNSVGGLVGNATGVTVTNSYATGTASGLNYVGGLVGFSQPVTVSNSYATGNVTLLTAGSNGGGLVGYLYGGSITSSYASGNVSGPSDVGGLTGTSQTNASVTKSYATGNVTLTSATGHAGGLIAYLPGSSASNISQNYATGFVTQTGGSSGNLGGLIGFGNARTFSDNYWNTSNNPALSTTLGGIGGSTSATSGVTAISTADMKSAASFSSGFGNSSGTFTGASGWGYADAVNSGLPVLCVITNCTNYVTSVLNDTFIGASGGLWSLGTNWDLGYAPTVSNSATITAAIINADKSVNYDTASAGNVSTAIQNAGSLSFSGSSNVTLSGLISGAGSLTMAGSGTVTLTGANTYSGGTTISAGTLQVGAGSTTGAMAGNVTNNATLAFNRSDALAYSGVISGTGAVTKAGAGTLTFSGNNTYTGGTTISAGTLQIGAGSTTGTFAGDVVNNATLAFNRSDALTYSGAISGTGAVTKLGTGTTALSGTNTYSGGTTISAGTLQIGAGSTSGSIAGNVTNNATLALNRSDDVAYAGVISGTGSVTKLGAGTTILSGTNTYVGGTTISAGTLKVGNAYALGNSGGGAISVASGAALDLNGFGLVNTNTITLNGTGISSGGALTNSGTGVAISNPIVLASDTSIGSSIANLNLSGVISGAGNLTKIGSANSTFSGINTYTGTTTVTGGGILAISNAQGLGSTDGGTIVSSSGRLLLNGLSVGAEAITLNGGSLEVQSGTSSLSGTVTLGANSSVRVDSAAQLTLSGVVSGTGSLNKIQPGTLVLTGTNTYSGGTTFNATGGTVQLGAGGTNGSITGNVVNTGGTLVFNRSDNLTYAGVISGTGAVTKLGANTLTFSGNNTYSGGTTISAGTLQVGAGSTSGAIAGNVTNNATLAFNRSDDLTYAGAISGTGALTKLGTGTTSLSGTNTYSGTTTISAGTLQIGAGSTTGSIAGDVVNNATLAFNRSDDLTYAGAISGTGGLTKLGAGALTLSGTNTYNGTSNISAGTVKAASAGALGAGALSIGASGVLDLTYSGTVALGSTLSMSSGAAITNSVNTSNLSVAGASTLSGSINTAGNQTYTGAVTLGGNTTLTTLNASQANTNGTITFGAAVDGTASGAQSLTITSGTGAVSFGSTVGNTTPLSALTITGGSVATGQTTTLGGNVTTSGNQSFGGNLILGANTSLTSTANSGNGTVTIAGAVDTTSTISAGILKFLGLGYWAISTSSGSTWAYYLSGSNGNTYQPTVTLGSASYTSTLSALSSLPTVTYGSGTYAWTPALSTPISLLLVGGGGSGGESVYVGGGGGGGGGGVIFANSYTASNQVAITVGAGGAAINNPNGYVGNSGQSSTFGSLTALGGGGGGIFWNSGTTGGALAGGSGGGGQGTNGSNNLGAAAGGSTTVGTYYANAGGNGLTNGLYFAGGGGGAGSAGGNATATQSGAGGSGYLSSITGTASYYGAGGGGSAGNTTDTNTIGLGGSGVGGNGSVGASATTLLATSGVTNTGSGGGGSVNGGIGGTAANKPSGAGGSGIVVLNGNVLNAQSTYALTINSGAGKASIGGSVANVSTLTINSTSALSEIAGAISGSTALTKSGTNGVLTLSGANTYSGTTTISAGTLQVGAGSTTGSIAGNVVNNATLAFNRSDDLTFAGVISGTGAVTKSGAGTLTLSGTNTYTGATTVSAGTLAITNAAGLGDVAAGTTVANGATLDLKGVTVGAEALTLNGSTLTASSGTSSLSGAVNLTSASILSGAGALTLSGAITSNGNGLAILGTGAKTLSSTSNNLSTLATGSGIGVLNVVNNAAMTIGQVTAGGTTYNGINSTGTVSVVTRTGDLTVSQNVVTTSTASNYITPALKLGAGSLTAAGTPTGGDVVLSGTPTMSVGTGGVALIYSGYATTSAARTLGNSFAPKLSYYTINSDSTYVPTVVTSAYFTLFRESPATLYTLYVPGQRSTYGTPITSLNYCYSTSASSCSPVTVTGVPSTTQAVAINNAVLDAGTYPLTIAPPPPDVTGYFFRAGNAVDIVVDRKPVTVTTTARTTTYNGLSTYSDLANAMTYTVSGLVGSDAVRAVTQTPSGNGLVASNVANAGTFTVTPSATVLSTGNAGNYTFSYTAAMATVNKADLTVKANNDAKFVGEADASGFGGVSYKGFVAGQTASVLSGTATVARSNASVGGAGTYTGVLSASASTLSSNNYNFIYEAGNYTIVPADQLLIRLNDASTTYGTTPTYTVSSVQYKSSTGNAVVDLTNRASVNTTAFTLADGAGGNTALTLGPVSGSLSSAGQVAAGNYQLGASSITNTSANYSNTVNIVGTLNVAQKSLTVAAVSGLSKTYDGTTGMTSLGLGLTGLVGTDAVTASGLGTYADANAGSSKSFAVTGIGLGGADAANYRLNTNTLSATNGVITTAPLLITANNDSKTYDANAYAATAGVRYSGFVNGETATVLGGTLIYGGSAIGAVNVGNYAITPSGQSSSNYAITFGNGALSISPADVRVSATNVALTGTVGKVYDGTNVATLTANNYVITGWQGSDGANITLTTGTYDNANAGTNKLVSVTLASSDYTPTNGTLLTNYNLPTAVSGYVGVISPKAVTVTNASRSSTYDGVSSYVSLASGTTYTVGTMVGLDAVASVTQTPSGFSGGASGAAQAGTFSITPSAAVLGTGAASNYSFSYVNSTYTVNQAPLSVTFTGTSSKVYNGNTAATLAAGNFALTGFVNSEGASVNQTSGTLDTANVGASKVVTAALSSSNFAANNGTLLSNYMLPTSVSGSIGTVTPAPLSATLTGTSSKVYDGSTAASLAAGNFALTGFVNSEGASVSQTSGTLDNANVGTSKVVTASLSSSDFAALGGTQLSNYTLPTSASGSIGAVTAAPLTATLTGTSSKVYNGNTAATLAAANFALTGFVNSEGASVSQTSGTLDTANVGTSKTVTAALSSSNLTANTGTLLSNYTLPTSASGSIGTVTAAPLSATLTGTSSKVYDGNTAATLAAGNFALTGFVSTEGASVSQTSGTLDTANVGTSKTVTTALSSSNLTANTGTLLSNYTLPTSASGSIGTVTPASLTATLTGTSSKVYDGNTAATLAAGNFALTGFVSTEGASVSQTAGTLDTANVGASKVVTAALSSSNFAANNGTLLSNYTLPTSASGSIGTVTPARLTLTASTNTKNFDGKTDAQAIPTVIGLIGSDTVTNLVETYADANPGSGKTLNVQARYQLSDGNNGNNYAVTLVANQTGEIRAQAVSVRAPDVESTSTTTATPPTLTLYSAGSTPAPAPAIAAAATVPEPASAAPATASATAAAAPTPASATPAPASAAPAPSSAAPAAASGTTAAASSSSTSGTVGASSSSGVVVNTINSPTVQVSGLVAVMVPAGTATSGSGLVIALPEQVLSAASANASVQVTLPNKEPLPSWIRYDPASQTLVTTAVPAGAFPISVVVTVGGQSTVIQISESQANP